MKNWLEGFFGAMIVVVGLTGCATYVTPGGGANIAELAAVTDADVQALLERRAVAPFPARLVVVRIQGGNYRSYSSPWYGAEGSGRYAMVPVRELETEAQRDQLKGLPNLVGVAPLNAVVLRSSVESEKDLRLAAARVQADLLLVYTVNTRFWVEDNEIGPLGVLTLGTLPNKDAKVVATASAAVFDVRTGYVYGLCEGTADASQVTSSWSTSEAIDESRLRAERRAVDEMVSEFAQLWRGIVDEYARGEG